MLKARINVNIILFSNTTLKSSFAYYFGRNIIDHYCKCTLSGFLFFCQTLTGSKCQKRKRSEEQQQRCLITLEIEHREKRNVSSKKEKPTAKRLN